MYLCENKVKVIVMLGWYVMGRFLLGESIFWIHGWLCKVEDMMIFLVYHLVVVLYQFVLCGVLVGDFVVLVLFFVI